MPIRQVSTPTGLPSLVGRVPQIDLLKGLAIVAVLALHALPADRLFDAAALIHIGQAVPVFALLMGLNAQASHRRRGAERLGALYTRGYVASRIDRLYTPFLIIFAISLVAALIRGEARIGFFAGLVTGELATSGPGNYFIGLALQFAVLGPALFVAYRRWPRATVALAVVGSLLFELAAQHVGLFASHPYFYDASILRFVPYVVAGMVLADVLARGGAIDRRWLLAGAAALAYLVALAIEPELLPLATDDWRPWGVNALAVPYTATLVVLGLRYLPTGDGRAGRALGALGRASYHVFLAQILWFALIETRSLAILPLDVVACCAIGYAFFLLSERLPTVAQPQPAAAPVAPPVEPAPAG